MVVAANNSIVRLTDLPSRLLVQPGMNDVIARLREGCDATIDGAWGSSAALAVVALSQQAPSSLIVVLPHEKDLDGFTTDAASFGVEPQSNSPATSSKSSGGRALGVERRWALSRCVTPGRGITS